MSRFKKQSPTIWFCEYHIVWCPRYRDRVLQGKIKEEAELCAREQTRQMECEVVGLNVQADPVHWVVMIPPQVRIADYLGRRKGKTAIRLFSVFRDLRRHPYWGNPFWVEGYCVATVGLDEEKIRKHVKYHEQQERRQEEFRFSRWPTPGDNGCWPSPLWGLGLWPLIEGHSSIPRPLGVDPYFKPICTVLNLFAAMSISTTANAMYNTVSGWCRWRGSKPD